MKNKEPLVCIFCLAKCSTTHTLSKKKRVLIKSFCTFKRQVNRRQDTDWFSSPVNTHGEQTYFLLGTTFNWVLSSVNSRIRAPCELARTPLSVSSISLGHCLQETT